MKSPTPPVDRDWSARILRILVIEDDEDDFVLVRDLLETIAQDRVEVNWASTFEAGLRSLREGGYEVCLLDYRLGAETGLGLLEQAHDLNVWLPAVIFLTGQGDRHTDIEAMRAGAADFLVKAELTAETLERSVRYAVNERETIDALHSSEAHFRSVVENALDLITIFERDGAVRYQSPSVAWTLGEEATRLDAAGLRARIHPEDEQAVEDAYRRLIGSPGGQASVEFRFQDGRDSWRYLESIARNHIGEPGVDAIIVNTRDTTARRLAEEEIRAASQTLERSNAELRRFAYVASHDLREPLRAIAGFSQLLAKRYGEKLGDDAAEFISYIVDAAKQMNRLISDLLAYSRLESLEQREPVEVAAVLRRALTNLDRALRDSGAKVQVEELPTLRSDRVKLLQIFQNLLSNALKFRGPRPPEVRVWAEERPTEWIFAVKDNGIGIDSNDFEKIMGVFQRLHDSSVYPGTGIGLAICRKAAEQLGGRIWLESKLGAGSTFFLALPKEVEMHE